MGKVEIVIPEAAISEGISQHLFWIKGQGDVVKAGDSVASVEASKGLAFISAPVAGVLCEQSVPRGAAVRAGDVVGYIEQS